MESAAKSHLPEIDNDAFNLFEIPNLTGTPERRLLLAILERAVLDLVGNDEKEAQEAEDWLFGELLSEETDIAQSRAHHAAMFSFPWVCDQLDLDQARISTKIRNMPKRGKNRIAPWHLAKRSEVLEG